MGFLNPTARLLMRIRLLFGSQNVQSLGTLDLPGSLEGKSRGASVSVD